MLVLKMHTGIKNASNENANACTFTENGGVVKLWYRKMPLPENFDTGNSGTEHMGTGSRKY